MAESLTWWAYICICTRQQFSHAKRPLLIGLKLNDWRMWSVWWFTGNNVMKRRRKSFLLQKHSFAKKIRTIRSLRWTFAFMKNLSTILDQAGSIEPQIFVSPTLRHNDLWENRSSFWPVNNSKSLIHNFLRFVTE